MRHAVVPLLLSQFARARWTGEPPLEHGLEVPTRAPLDREIADSGVNKAMAQTMPFFPTHQTVCGGRPCRPGEGNLPHRREETDHGWRFKQWTQPYLHREAWVQTRSRGLPHHPVPPEAHYGHLVSVARRVQTDNLVVVTSGDWDYRELVLNWVMHCHKLRWYNALVLAMDQELYRDLDGRSIPAADHHALLLAWNTTCLQRHIQAVRMERQLAIAALVAAGLDVLHTDATCIVRVDFLPMLKSVPDVDILAQRDGWPSDPIRKIGTAANAGFNYLRASRNGAAVAQFMVDVVERGLIEFYLRWNNIPDQYGWSFLMGDLRKTWTSPKANETTVGTLHARGSHCAKSGNCLRAGFLPFDQFPRTGDWEELKSKASIYHLTYGCMQEEAPCQVPGIRPFRGHRQRLDRYEAVDFDDQVDTLRKLGLWLVDKTPEYRVSDSALLKRWAGKSRRATMELR